MTPLVQGVVAVCVVALTAVLVATLLALRKTALRAESLLQALEREVRPMIGQLETLTEEVRDLSREANHEMKRIGALVTRAEDATIKVSRLLAALSTLTSIGQYAGLAAGVKRGLDVFVRRLRAKG